jgi:hypothetical protein
MWWQARHWSNAVRICEVAVRHRAGEPIASQISGDLIHLGIAQRLRLACKGNAGQEWQNRNSS